VLWLAPILLGQAEHVAGPGIDLTGLDPGILALKLGGPLGVAYLLGRVAQPFIAPLALAWKRKLGDQEMLDKNGSRDAIKRIDMVTAVMGERMAEIAATQRVTTEIQRDMLAEMKEFRRETDKSLERLERKP
jgi:hypothetical protein